MSVNCENCKSSINEDSKFCYNCGEKVTQNTTENSDKVLKYSGANSGFTSGILYAYSDKIEFVSEKKIIKIYYSNLERVKKTFGSLDLRTIDGSEAFGIPDDDEVDVDEWVKFIDGRMIYCKEINPSSKKYQDSTIKAGEEPFYDKVKRLLKEKDGKVHVVMISNRDEFKHGKTYTCSEYTFEVDDILSYMQDDGYEIIDVKFEMYEKIYYRTLIMYR